MTIDEIRAMLAKITPGKWTREAYLGTDSWVLTNCTEADADFIAKAPEIVAWLLKNLDDELHQKRLCIKRDQENLYYSEILAELREQNKNIGKRVNEWREDNGRLVAENKKLRAEVERLISANQTLRNAATCTSVELAVENSQLLNEVERLRREGVGKYMCACDGLTVATCSGCGNPKVRP